MLVRWYANDCVAPPQVETESAFKLLKSKWRKSHGEGAWRLDLDHISRARRHRTRRHRARRHRQRVQSARLRSAAARYLSLLGLTLQGPDCAAHSARSAEPSGMVWP